MKQGERAERLWLAIAVGTLWVVSIGGVAEARSETWELPEQALRRRRSGTKWRVRGVYRRGLAVVLIGLMKQEINLPGWFEPEEWPSVEDRLSEADRRNSDNHEKTYP